MTNSLDQQDVMGAALLDYQLGAPWENIITHSSVGGRDEMSLPYLFRAYPEMPLVEQTALDLAHGRVLDLGCGAGSHSLYLQENGLETTGLDLSSGAVRTSRLRGVRRVVHADLWRFEEGGFDTILGLMNGVGLCGTLEKLPDFLRLIKKMLQSGGIALLDSSDIIYMYDDEPGHAKPVEEDSYYGETVFEMSYKSLRSGKFPWLYVDYPLLERCAKQSGLGCEKVVDGPHYDYLAKLWIPKFG